MAGAWARAFRADAPPELSRKIGRDCEREIGRSPWTRDGSLALFTCIRRKGEEAGYSYNSTRSPPRRRRKAPWLETPPPAPQSPAADFSLSYMARPVA